jgi:hypothetical protein
MTKVKCDWCDKMFDPAKRKDRIGSRTFKYTKYCSKSCCSKRNDSIRNEKLKAETREKRHGVKKTCDECGKEMDAYKAGTGVARRYCSDECKRIIKNRNTLKSEAYQEQLKRSQEKCRLEREQRPKGRNCGYCGTWFNYKTAQSKPIKWGDVHKSVEFVYTRQEYCCRKCTTEAHKERTGTFPNGKPVKVPVRVQCAAPGCDNMFSTTKGVLERAHRAKKYCSHNCACTTWRLNNLELSRKMARESARRNREVGKRYQLMLKKTNPSYAMACRLRGRLRAALKQAGLNPNKPHRKSTEELVGCSFGDLVTHIESKFTVGMDWDVFLNAGFSGIHIDHIMPCAAFDLTKEEEQRKCFHWSNLQPLWAVDNLSKGARYEGREAGHIQNSC